MMIPEYALYVILGVQTLVIVYVLVKVRSETPLTRTARQIEKKELDLKKVGGSLKKLKPTIIKQFVKKGDKETEDDYKGRVKKVEDTIDGIAELFESDAIPMFYDGIKKAISP